MESKDNPPRELVATLKGNIVIPPPWWDEEKQCWLEWIPWDEV